MLNRQESHDELRRKWYEKIWRLLYDTSFFNRLFPMITQQKPGKDLYVYIMTIQIVIISYIFLFFNLMVKSVNDDLSD